MTGFKHTFIDVNGVTHIVAMPTSLNPFTACGAWSHFGHENILPLQPVTCLRCWWRELLEYEITRETVAEAFVNAVNRLNAGPGQ